jgi:sec-independent protein translocase protein TatC
MRQFRKHAIVGIVITSAIITPSSDPFTLMLVALPLYLLFEISIFVSAIEVNRKKKQEDAELLADQQKN